ncbi:MAG: hypothetical protein M3P52_05995 [Actinomycetota bacterium]|nr:hypothetical protein [Actinomycetota bacterium]
MAQPAFADEAAAAAAAINRSGSKLRLVATSRRRQALVIVSRWNSSCSGQAEYGPIVTRHTPGRRPVTRRTQATVIRFGPCAANPDVTFLDAEARLGTIRVMAHEFLHAVGLGHDNRRCALMNTSATRARDSGSPLPNGCTDVQHLPAASYYCALLEPDDQRGLIAIHGGRVRPLGPRICARESPSAVGGLTGTPGFDPALGQSIISVSWSPIGAAFTDVQVFVHPGTCPPEPATLTPATSVNQATWRPDFDTLPVTLGVRTPGTWCVSANAGRTLGIERLSGPVAAVTVVSQ